MARQVEVDTQAGGTSQPKTAPIFRIHESRASFAGVAESNFDGNRYTDYVSETRGRHLRAPGRRDAAAHLRQR